MQTCLVGNDLPYLTTKKCHSSWSKNLEEQLKRSIIKDFKARLGFKTKFKKSVLNATIYCNWGIDPCSILIWSLKSCAVVFCQSANLCATMLKVLVVIIVLKTRTDWPNRPVQSRTGSQFDLKKKGFDARFGF